MSQAKTIPTVAQAHHAIAYDILLKLYQPPIGNVRFDAMTRTKVTEGLVAALDAEGIKKYTNWLISFIIQGDQPSILQTNGAEDDADMEEEEENADAQAKLVENRRLWAIDQLGLLIRKHAKALPVDTEAATALSSPEYSWITRILQFLIVSGFTKVLKTTKKSDIEALRYKSEEPFSNSLQASIRSRFFAALSHLVTANTKCRSEPWVKMSLDTLFALQKDTKHVSPLTSEETVENVKPAVKLLSRVKTLVS